MDELAVPALGFPDAPKTHNLHDTIIIIVSHSGGTFAPLHAQRWCPRTVVSSSCSRPDDLTSSFILQAPLGTFSFA
jgi:hypothetical protein